MKILVIDDEPIIHESLRKVLSREGFQVETALSGSEGLSLLSRQSYDVVITDLMMPGMDGLELLEEMQKASLAIPTIMITGYPTIRTALLALRLGATDYIPKPFTRRELLPPIWRALRKNVQGSHTAGDGLEHTHPGSIAREHTHRAAVSPFPPPTPGDRFRLLEHSWAVYQQNGTVSIGIEPSFLSSIERVVSIHAPPEDDLVEQGFPGITLVTADGQEHAVFLPLSGRVVERNKAVLADPSRLDALTWVVRIIPSLLKEELPYLQRDPDPSR
jgi:DNA-binding response OmpR family regulator